MITNHKQHLINKTLEMNSRVCTRRNFFIFNIVISVNFESPLCQNNNRMGDIQNLYFVSIHAMQYKKIHSSFLNETSFYLV